MDSKTFSALAEPTRLQIIELLRKQPCSVNDVVKSLKIRQPQASKHLHILKEAHVVIMQPAAQARVYTLNPEAFLQLEDWVRSFNSYWGKRLSKLDDYLKQLSERQ